MQKFFFLGLFFVLSVCAQEHLYKDKYDLFEEICKSALKSGGILQWGEEDVFSATLLLVSDRKSQKQVESWFLQNTQRLLEYQNLRQIHLLFPGGISFLTPMPAVKSRVREEILQIRERIYQTLSESQKKIFDSSRVVWYLDRKRELIDKTALPRLVFSAIVLEHKTRKIYEFTDLLETTEAFFGSLNQISSAAQSLTTK